MNYLSALEIIHRELNPDNYLEIGCRLGRSLSLSRCQSIAIDPDFEIKVQIEAPTRLFKMTSDRFFQEYNVKQFLGGPIDLAFIDGMHKAEFALRDFISVEQNGHAGTVIIIDDIMPEKIEWATRERVFNEWTGDVYQVIAILRQYRPDLKILILDIEMKGMAIITEINPASATLSQSYAEIERGILSDQYKMESSDSIRRTMEPLPTDQLHDVLMKIRLMRSRLFDRQMASEG